MMPLLSIVIPAHDEERFLGATLEALNEGIAAADIASHEIVVVDDASTDRTAEIARAAGARVVASGKRNIAASRNAGARATTGSRLLFVDADTLVTGAALQAVMRAFDEGVVGGGARMAWDRRVRLSGELALHAWNIISAASASPAGGFFFMTRNAWETAGGFDETVYVSEELWLGFALRKIGRVKIIDPKVVTSSRKLQSHSMKEFLSLFARLARSPFRTIRDRRALDLWYVRRH